MNSPRLRTAYSPLFAWEDCTFVNQFVTRSGVGHPDDFFLEGACAGDVDVVNKEKAYEITAELPGMDESNIEVKVSDGTLTIKGEKKEEKEEK